MVVKVLDRELTLIGTAHVSRESIDEVRRIIQEERPDMVCVELDDGRYKSIAEQDNWEKLDVAKIFRQGKGFLLIANLVLSSFQRRLGDELGVKPGEEMKVAIETAVELDIPYALCDREVQITLRRAWTRCNFWSKSKLLASLLSSVFTTEKLSEEDIENLKNRNELDGMMAELAAYLPRVKETLIDERDRYLAAKIWAASGKRLVAVVGAGHIQGISTHIEKIASDAEDGDVSALDTVPTSGSFARIAGWIIPALIVALVVFGFLRAGVEGSFSMILRWLLWNGSLAAAGAIAALGHPLSILVSFVGAPIGTLSPFISVGVLSGITEAMVRKPRVADAQSLSADVTSLRGIYRNRITRALLVFLLSTLGGALGNMISIFTGLSIINH
jgi:pheromone shutdown-related protein TraB